MKLCVGAGLPQLVTSGDPSNEFPRFQPGGISFATCWGVSCPVVPPLALLALVGAPELDDDEPEAWELPAPLDGREEPALELPPEANDADERPLDPVDVDPVPPSPLPPDAEVEPDAEVAGVELDELLRSTEFPAFESAALEPHPASATTATAQSAAARRRTGRTG